MAHSLEGNNCSEEAMAKVLDGLPISYTDAMYKELVKPVYHPERCSLAMHMHL